MNRERPRAASGVPRAGLHPPAHVPLRGRPRSADADRAILVAAFRQLVAVGYGALSIESVAAEAGVAKTTVYRRYPSKRELTVAAFGQETPFTPPPGDLPAREMLERFVAGAVTALVDSGAVRILASLLVEEQREPGILAVFRSRLIEPRLALVEAMLRRGIERGEIRPDIDPMIVAEMVAGAIFGHHAILGLPGGDDWVRRLTEHVWAAVELP